MNQRLQLDMVRNHRHRFNRFRPAAADRRLIEQKPGCLGCGTCAHSCKNRALSCDFTDVEMIKWWDAERCQRCGKCIQRCPNSLLSFVEAEPGTASAGKIELMRLGVLSCLGCGTAVREENGPLCMTCRRQKKFP